MHLACKRGHLSVAKLLLKYGARLNAIDFLGDTPLYKSIQGENRLLTKFLLSQENINLCISNEVGERLIHTAVKFNDLYLVETLLKLGEDLNVITDTGNKYFYLFIVHFY